MGKPVKDGTAVRFEVECPRCACIIPLAILREENVFEDDNEGEELDPDTVN